MDITVPSGNVATVTSHSKGVDFGDENRGSIFFRNDLTAPTNSLPCEVPPRHTEPPPKSASLTPFPLYMFWVPLSTKDSVRAS